MAAAKCTDAEFIKIWGECGGSPAGVATRLNITERAVYFRRNRLSDRLGKHLASVSNNINYPTKICVPADKIRVNVEMANGVIVIGSDCHYWPGLISDGHKAFVAVINALKPDIVVMNGDVFDGAQISRHDRLGWDRRPTVKEELEAAKDRLFEIQKVAGNAKLLWTVGNHDLRFNMRLATVANEFDGTPGFALIDHFPGWTECMSVMVNDDTQIKHRAASGIHAVYNNTVKTGINIVTGHLHSPKAIPWTDMKGTRWGVDCGTLADPWGPQFDYLEDGARNWRSGFSVLTFEDGVMLPPEHCLIIGENLACFRGKTFAVTAS